MKSSFSAFLSGVEFYASYIQILRNPPMCSVNGTRMINNKMNGRDKLNSISNYNVNHLFIIDGA